MSDPFFAPHVATGPRFHNPLETPKRTLVECSADDEWTQEETP